MILLSIVSYEIFFSIIFLGRVFHRGYVLLKKHLRRHSDVIVKSEYSICVLLCIFVLSFRNCSFLLKVGIRLLLISPKVQKAFVIKKYRTGRLLRRILRFVEWSSLDLLKQANFNSPNRVAVRNITRIAYSVLMRFLPFILIHDHNVFIVLNS